MSTSDKTSKTNDRDQTIDNYFELTYFLVTKYINSIFPRDANYKLSVTTDEIKLKQLELYKSTDNNDEERFLLFSFTKLSETQSLINLLNNNGRLDNALINWDWFVIDEKIDINFPLNTTDISSQLVEKFNTKFRLIVDDEKNSSIFNTDDDKAKSKNYDGPIIEESNTDTESVNARSPTPEVPYNPSVAQSKDLKSSTIPSENSAFARQLQDVDSDTTRPPDMPDFDDEYQIKDARKTHSQREFPSIGGDDLNPPGLPKHPLMQPHLDPLSPQQHQQPFGSGGMYPSRDHPIFGQHPQSQTSRLGVPPGARFDDPYSEENLDNLGQGLPSNLRSLNRGSGSGPNPPFGNFGPSGGSFGGGHNGGGFNL